MTTLFAAMDDRLVVVVTSGANRVSEDRLADHFGVTPRTLLNWFNRIEPQLIELGYNKHMKVLTPKLTRFVLGWFG